MTKRVHVFYSGSVQGVGFRYTARDIAEELGISGWVKNLRDGRVEVIAEAEKETLQQFLDSIKGQFKNYIEDIDISWQDASSEFDNFDIRF